MQDVHHDLVPSPSSLANNILKDESVIGENRQVVPGKCKEPHKVRSKVYYFHRHVIDIAGLRWIFFPSHFKEQVSSGSQGSINFYGDLRTMIVTLIQKVKNYSY